MCRLLFSVVNNQLAKRSVVGALVKLARIRFPGNTWYQNLEFIEVVFHAGFKPGDLDFNMEGDPNIHFNLIQYLPDNDRIPLFRSGWMHFSRKTCKTHSLKSSQFSTLHSLPWHLPGNSTTSIYPFLQGVNA